MSEKKQANRAAAKGPAIASAYKELFETPAGRIVLNDLMTECHLLQTSYVAKDPEKTFFNEGQRNVALYIITKLNLDEKELLKTLKKGVEDEFRYTKDFLSTEY